MQGARTQNRHTASTGGWIFDVFAKVNAWRGGAADPLPAKSWIDAGATPEAVVFRVGQVQMAHPAFAGGWVMRTRFGGVTHNVKVTEKVPTWVYPSYIVPVNVMEKGLQE
jgi:hypothetical protein